MKKNREEELIKAVVASLKQLRLKKGLSHNKLSILAGVTRPAISQIESGKRKPTLTLCLKLSHALDKSLGDIISKCEREIEIS